MRWSATLSLPVSRYLHRPLRSYADVLRQRAASAAEADACSFEQHLAPTGLVQRTYGAPCACAAVRSPSIPHAPVNGAAYASGANGAAGHGSAPVNGTAAAAAVASEPHAPTWSGPTFKADRPVLAIFVAALARDPGAAAEITAGYVEVHPRLAVRLVAKALAAQPGQAEKIVGAVKGKKRFGLSWLAVLALLVVELIGLERAAEAAPRDSSEANDRHDAADPQPTGPLRILWAATAAMVVAAVATELTAASDAMAQSVAGGDLGTAAALLEALGPGARHDAATLDSADIRHGANSPASGASSSTAPGEAVEPSLRPAHETAQPSPFDQPNQPGSANDTSTPASAAAPLSVSSEPLPLTLAAPDGAAADPILGGLDLVSSADDLRDLPQWLLNARPESGDGTFGRQDLFGQLWDRAFDERFDLGDVPDWMDTPREAMALLGRLADAQLDRAPVVALADVIDGSPLPDGPTPQQLLHHWMAENGFTADNPPSIELLPPALVQIFADQLAPAAA